MNPAQRAAHGTRQRRRGRAPTAAQKRGWQDNPDWLEQRAKRLIDHALTAPLVKSRANGPQMSPKFAAGVKLFELAEKYRARDGRSGPSDPPASDPTKPRSLTDYRRRA